MKILFLSKRRPQGRDLLTRPYGRFFHIPHTLAQRGHEVTLLLLSYKKEPCLTVEKEGFAWISESLYPTGPFTYIARAKRLVEQFKPDWIVGFSDTYYGIIAVELGQRYHISSVVDAYDNYESYMPWLKPLHLVWRRALAKATLITAAGPALAEYMTTSRPGKTVSIVPMAADPGFQPRDKAECRRRLGLPVDKRIIGYCGSLYRNRDVETMFRAFEVLTREDQNLELVASGRKWKRLFLPQRLKHLGYISDELVPVFLNGLDVLLVPNRLSDYGKFSHPVKLYEAMRCQIPVVATDTPSTNWILQNRKDFLARPEDPVDLVFKIKQLLPRDRIDYGDQNTWGKSSQLFEEVLLSEQHRCGRH
jgi:glycosyltransferase involved in cell wall biosynthesis